jgi:hypothetical protein
VDKDDIIKMLYTEHQRQVTVRREKIHGITERTIGILTVIGGWLLIGNTRLSEPLKWVLVFQVATLGGAACYSVYANNKAYLRTAQVIQKLNRVLGLYEPGAIVPNESLYLSPSDNFGAQGILDGAVPHWLTIISICVLCLLAAWLK